MKMVGLIITSLLALTGGAVARCHEAGNETRFRYCDDAASSIELSRPAVTGAPAVFHDGYRQGVSAEIRLPKETVEAALAKFWGGGRMENYPLIIESPADAAKVARAVNAGQRFDIVLTSPAGEALVAFSGTLDGAIPQDAVIESAPDTDKSEKSAAPAAPPQPEKKNIGYADPIGAACAGDAMRSGLYDCACVAEKARPLREEIADKRFGEQRKYIPRRTKSLEAARKQLAGAASEQQRRSAERLVERAEKTLADLQVRPDPASIDVNAVALRAYDGSACKVGDYIREKEKKDCLAAASLWSGVSDTAAFCACAANRAAESWLRSDKPYKSTLAVQMATEARQACRN